MFLREAERDMNKKVIIIYNLQILAIESKW